MSAHRPYHRILVWFRRALRVDDNPALWNALHDGEEVVPLLCLSNASSYQKLTERRKFLRSAIRSLDADLRDRGTALHVRLGNPAVAIPAAVAAYQADAVYAVALHDAPGMHPDARLKQELAGMGATLILWPDRVMREANQVLNASDRPIRSSHPTSGHGCRVLTMCRGRSPCLAGFAGLDSPTGVSLLRLSHGLPWGREMKPLMHNTCSVRF